MKGGKLKGDGMSERPNILVIMSDEHRASVMGCDGNDIIRTPHMDKLAEGGVMFENAYCNSPLCVPSRLSFTAGQYVSRCGGWNNDCWLPSEDYPSIARAMTAAGYDAVLCGKQHYDKTRRYGFHDLRVNDHTNQNNSHKTGLGGRRDPLDTVNNDKSRDGRFAQFRTGNESSVLHKDRNTTRGALKFLAERDANDKPFFLFAGYIGPHFPPIVPEEYWLRYKGRVPDPVIPEGHLESLPTNYKHLRYGFGVAETDPAMVTLGRELHYGLTEWVDKKIGEVLAGLAASPFADNTVVIYTSDHGENMGDHGLWWKNTMFDTGARVPLIVNWPARWKGGQRRTQVCSLVDVVQTICELGGAEAGEAWDGDSLCGLLDDGQAAWKDTAISEYYAHNICSGFTMYRQGRWKYVYHTRINEQFGPERELYDMESDPDEFVNLAGEAGQAERMVEMHRLMVAELGEDPEETEKRCRADYAKGYGR
jgi:choline-sulfatase